MFLAGESSDGGSNPFIASWFGAEADLSKILSSIRDGEDGIECIRLALVFLAGESSEGGSNLFLACFLTDAVSIEDDDGSVDVIRFSKVFSTGESEDGGSDFFLACVRGWIGIVSFDDIFKDATEWNGDMFCFFPSLNLVLEDGGPIFSAPNGEVVDVFSCRRFGILSTSFSS